MLDTSTNRQANLSWETRLPKTEQVNFRISESGKAILYALQEHYGVSQSAVFEMLLRDRARDLGLDMKNLRKLGNNRGR